MWVYDEALLCEHLSARRMSVESIEIAEENFLSGAMFMTDLMEIVYDKLVS